MFAPFLSTSILGTIRGKDVCQETEDEADEILGTYQQEEQRPYHSGCQDSMCLGTEGRPTLPNMEHHHKPNGRGLGDYHEKMGENSRDKHQRKKESRRILEVEE
uniref:Uncharacterized protein n=1 Tax=Photinus pyralis TaxID=7054 RepID=A0A1Y1MGW3_PHOPY